MIHDCLPFLYFPDSAIIRHRVDTTLIHGAWRRKQVGRVMARVLEQLDPRFERLTLLVLGRQR